MRKNVWLYAIFIGASLLFLWLEHLIHFEFLLHMAAIPLEVLVAVFIVEKFLENREAKDKRRQLMYIKSHLFRSEMRGLFISNFEALKSPAITLAGIKKASLEELREFRRQAETILYKSPEAMEPVILEYVRAERVWHNFLERAITYNFEEIFMDMIYILHFINDVKIFKQNYPDRFFILEAEKRPQIYAKVRKVLEDGIVKFLDYAIELKEKQPRMFVEVMSDYELSSQIRGI